jgi:hypothetical protein
LVFLHDLCVLVLLVEHLQLYDLLLLYLVYVVHHQFVELLQFEFL